MAKNTTNLVSVDSLVFEDNVRTSGCMNLPGMIDSIKRHGFKVNHPLVVSKRGDDSFLVLCGNRRGHALTYLRDNEPEAYATAVPSGKIPAVVHEGLTPEEEVLLRIDHSTDEDREPLDQWSEFQAIRQLVLIGCDSQEQIAIKLGIFHTKGKNKGTPNRSYIQPRVNLARLPGFVQEEMAKYCDDANSSPLRWSLISGLYKAYNTEMVEFPNGDGPLLSTAWQTARAPKPKEAKNEVTGHNLTPADARKKAQSCTSSTLKIALLSATGQGGAKLSDVDNIIKKLEDDSTIVGVLRAHLGNTLDEVIAEAVEALADQTAEVA
jgi:hypothetical protein